MKYAPGFDMTPQPTAMKIADRLRDRIIEGCFAPGQHLKKRSAFINITTEDIARITDRSETIYSIDQDPQAVPPPTDRTLIGR